MGTVRFVAEKTVPTSETVGFLTRSSGFGSHRFCDEIRFFCHPTEAKLWSIVRIVAKFWEFWRGRWERRNHSANINLRQYFGGISKKIRFGKSVCKYQPREHQFPLLVQMRPKNELIEDRPFAVHHYQDHIHKVLRGFYVSSTSSRHGIKVVSNL